MKPEEILFCKLMDLSLHPTNKNIISSSEQTQISESLSKLIELASLHNMLPALYDSLCLLAVTLPKDSETYLRRTVTSNCYKSYNLLAFTRKIIQILSKLPVTFYVLKGVTLLSCYPKMEYRRYGDVDILIPDAMEYEIAKKHLLALGFSPKKDLVDHHLELTYQENKTTYLLELHSKVIASQGNDTLNKQLLEIYRTLTPINGNFSDANLSFPMLPHTENALYLLLHMLQHFMSAGFGIKLLYDWVAYIETYEKQIQISKLKSYLNRLGLSSFSNAITSLCTKHLGLSPNICSSFITDSTNEGFLNDFMEDIISAGEFGKTDSARMLIMQKGGRYTQYFHELHRQMKNRFQKAYKIILLWPLLWIITAVYFLWNNRFLRKTKTSTLLATAHKRQKLLRNLKLFR